MKGCGALLLSLVCGSACGQGLIHTYFAPGSHGLNTFVGLNSGNPFMSLSEGLPYFASRNTAAGRNTLALNFRGWENTAVGANVLYSNIDGFHNTAVGYAAMASSEYGSDNTVVGYGAMYLNQAGVHNTAVGLQSLYRNIYGSFNVSVGRDANYSNTTGSWNTGLGVDAIPGVNVADGNTGVGGESGYTENLANQNLTGEFNTWIGYQSGPSSPAQHDGVIGVGYRSKTSKDWQAVFGSPQIVETLLYGNVGINATDPEAMLVVAGDAVNLSGVWEVYSDARLKQDVQRYEEGLDVVMALRPVSFRYNGAEGLSTDHVHVGLLAQEVEGVAPRMISTHAGREIDDVRTLSPQAVPYMLANAVQTLQDELSVLQKRLAELEARKGATATSEPAARP